MVVPFLVRTFDWGGGQAAKDRQLAEGSPAMAVIYTDDDQPANWLKAGEALAHLLLLAAHFGISASFLNQPLEVPDLRSKVASFVDVQHPQLILRMGFGPTPEKTPRKPLSDVLK